ncbi:hypothetical protein [Saccharothrix australiensis]|uniref:Uncharacterized protein n=1 Tax=Saccharothrix australiensis TaxID=2072 RepID=A0A495VSA0_9PSEU|nr:hypothetical protein [Saccharothrix australiensis]RKT51567.1 hypothetical protein C8E97_0046 [Saccharothrix australiensis]
MKAFRTGVVVVSIGFLAACGGGGDWSGDVRFEVTAVKPGEDLVSGQRGPGRVSLKLDQDQPGSPISDPWAHLDQVPPGTAVGDKLVCTVHKRDESKLDDAEAVQTIRACRKA